jgi:DNA-binding NarL/FixJ family response regulator
VRVFIAAENRLLREALARVVAKSESHEVAGLNSYTFDSSALVEAGTSVLLVASRGSIEEDCATIIGVRAKLPELRILLIGTASDEEEFLRCVQAGISGYLLRDASAHEVLEAVEVVHSGDAVCPGSWCQTLFHCFQRQSTTAPGSIRQAVEFTPRQQQLIPLIAQRLTNAEIARQLGLSEHTIKNHVHRMMRQTGAKDRLEVANCSARQTNLFGARS